jgi:hypothetical protein
MQVFASPFDDEKYMKKKSVKINESLTRRCPALVRTRTSPNDIQPLDMNSKSVVKGQFTDDVTIIP